ncbi:hypothetical protein GGQ87_000468 [Brevundimonas alba]|uniref:TonB C-terminal domain-containing protein n=1 Tax=Brevundimonas alba TaxID=74314 RepID=A0A7X5YKL8_9CAUL|nr:hypothetical protein [Brevundimonas alba]NJC40210.1 hypothetical protein [Brevundimonas alba]
MTQQYQPAGSQPSNSRDWRGLLPGAAVAAGLAAASAISLVHLSSAWDAGADFRANRAAEAEARRLRLEAEKAPPVAVPIPERRDIVAPPVVVTGSRPTGTQPAARAEPIRQTVRWVVRPNFAVRARDLPPGPGSVSVSFRCTVRRDGTLTGCSARETPAGSGLAALTRPALDSARMEPILIDGLPVESVATFAVSYELDAPPPRVAVTRQRDEPATSNSPAALIPPPAGSAAPPDPAPQDPPAAEPSAG